MMRFIALLLSLVAFPVLSVAQTAEPVSRVQNLQSLTEIFVERTTVKAGEPLWLGIRVTPIKGWHSYWENYGDTGKVPFFDWKLPEGWVADTPLYPVPYRIPVGPFMNYGYELPATLLVKLTPPATLPDAPIPMVMDGDWLVCEEICVPESGHFEWQMIPGKGSVTSEMARLFADARAALPQISPWQAHAEMNESASSLTVAMSDQEMALVRDAYFFPLTDGLVRYAAPQILEKTGDGLRLVTERPSNASLIDEVSGLLVMTNTTGEREGFSLVAPGSFVSGLVVPARAAHAAGGLPDMLAGMSAWKAILFAALGGMILNLMPCVFPILSLKAFALIRAHGAGEAAARRDGLAYGAGILASFLVVALVLLGLRAGGAQIGWGFQLQTPVIVTLLALLLFGLGLNLVGVYSFGGRLAGIGQSLTEKKGTSGAFFTGVLATIVATPCTAPFMASALGFAMFQPMPVAVAIFLSLGFGLALPYVLLTFIPALRHMLPRPGNWMETFRQFLAFPLFLTVIWLLWVLGRQAGTDAVAVALIALVALGFVLWLTGRLKGAGLKGRVAGGLGVVLVVGAMLSALTYLAGLGSEGSAGRIIAEGDAQGTQSSFEASLNVEPWSVARLAELRADGRPVFVYYTADWCITCKVNERVALDDAAVTSAMKDHGVVTLKADWTNRNDAIAQELARFGRNGVPLYLFYPADGSEPEILPQILTPGRVLSVVRGGVRTG